MGYLYEILIWAVPTVLAITLHEAAHGYAAKCYGDTTALSMGRVTLNPLAHVDAIGTVLVPVVLLVFTHGTALFGWAKPVPINPRNFRPFKEGFLVVSAAGCIANLLQGLAWTLALKLLVWTGLATQTVAAVCCAGVFVNFCLLGFNLIPLPPLDGGRILTLFLPWRLSSLFVEFERYGMLVLAVLIVSGFLNFWLHPFMSAAHNLLTFAAM